MPHGYLQALRYLSGYGQALFELGFVGAYLIVIVTWTIKTGFESWTVTIGMSAMMFSAVTMSSPLFALTVGYAVYMTEENKRLKIQER